VRSKLGFVVLGLGLFLLFLGLLSRFYIYPKVAVVPLDQVSAPKSEAIPDPENPPSVSIATDANIFSIAEGLTNITTDLTSTRVTIGQVEDAEELNEETGENLAIYETFSYTQDGEGRILSGTYDRVPFDRHTGEVYHCDEATAELCDEKTASAKLDPEATDVEGVEEDLDFIAPGANGDEGFQGFEGQYFKLPFNTQKETYQWWDGDLLQATDLKFEDTEDIQGLTTYRFVQEIPDTLVGTQEIPASVAGIDEDGDITVDSMYSNTRTLWIEPETGVLIKGQEEQHNYFAYEGEEVVTTTEATIGYDDATVTDNVDTYKPLATQLKIVRVWLPIGGLVLGLLLIGVSALMILRRGRSGSDDEVSGGNDGSDDANADGVSLAKA
jgi:hypothetical protein